MKKKRKHFFTDDETEDIIGTSLSASVITGAVVSLGARFLGNAEVISMSQELVEKIFCASAGAGLVAGASFEMAKFAYLKKSAKKLKNQNLELEEKLE